jgi:hypothetical protein
MQFFFSLIGQNLCFLKVTSTGQLNGTQNIDSVVVIRKILRNKELS